jgi:hypothetical protein
LLCGDSTDCIDVINYCLDTRAEDVVEIPRYKEVHAMVRGYCQVKCITSCFIRNRDLRMDAKKDAG